MRLCCFIIGSIFFSTSAFAGIRQDTKLHVEYTALASVGSSFICQYGFGASKLDSFICGFGTGMIIGISKEVLDSNQAGNNFSGHDIKSDVIGSLVGALAYRVTDDVIISPIFRSKENFVGVNMRMKI